MKAGAAWLVGVLLVLSMSCWAQDVPEEARRYMVRGRTAIEMAKTTDDLRFAVKELEQAARLAPQWADPYFNLGVVHEKLGNTAGAITSFKRYLELAPGADDAAKVRDKIIALEYRQERTAQAVALSGNWSGYTVRVDGDRFTAVGNSRPAPVEVIFHGMAGEIPQGSKLPDAVHRFEGQIAGATIKGIVTRDVFIEGRSGCEIPKERSEFTGNVNDAGTQIVLKFPRTTYRADWTGVFWGLENCTGVSAKDTQPAEFVLAPSLPTAGVGMELRFDTADTVPEVIRVVPGGPADQAGVRSGDRILAIDGQASRGLRNVDVIKRLRGESGTTVVVGIGRGGNETPEDLTLTRADLAALGVSQQADAGAVGAKKGVSATSSGCFIATAAYGAPLEEHVATLREFRDQRLLTNAPGRWFVEQYYAHSPPVAAYIRDREGLRTVVRALLTPVVHAIRHPLWALLAVCSLIVGGGYLGRRLKRQWHGGIVWGK
jgi:hypothetical protein